MIQNQSFALFTDTRPGNWQTTVYSVVGPLTISLHLDSSPELAKMLHACLGAPHFTLTSWGKCIAPRISLIAHALVDALLTAASLCSPSGALAQGPGVGGCSPAACSCGCASQPGASWQSALLGWMSSFRAAGVVLSTPPHSALPHAAVEADPRAAPDAHQMYYEIL